MHQELRKFVEDGLEHREANPEILANPDYLEKIGNIIIAGWDLFLEAEARAGA